MSTASVSLAELDEQSQASANSLSLADLDKQAGPANPAQPLDEAAIDPLGPGSAGYQKSQPSMAGPFPVPADVPSHPNTADPGIGRFTVREEPSTSLSAGLRLAMAGQARLAPRSSAVAAWPENQPAPDPEHGAGREAWTNIPPEPESLGAGAREPEIAAAVDQEAAVYHSLPSQRRLSTQPVSRPGSSTNGQPAVRAEAAKAASAMAKADQPAGMAVRVGSGQGPATRRTTVHRPGGKPQPTTSEIKSYIREQAKLYGVPDYLALGVAQKESSFNPTEVGSKREAGLFQVLPDNGGKVFKDGQGRKFTVNMHRAYSDWQYNTRVGMALLREAYQYARVHAPNDVVAATAARYNAGGNWRAYKNPKSSVYRHVYGYFRYRPHHAPEFIPGYVGDFHSNGAPEK